MSKLELSFGCWNYDRMRSIQTGQVRPDGIDLNYLEMPVEETFFRMARFQEFDISEMSFSSYVVSLFRPEPPFVAIPVFPSRCFRHWCIYVNATSGIKEPKDLIGKKIGVPEYQMTAPVWIRGILQDEYGVPVDSVTYHSGGEEETGRIEKQKLNLPENISVTPIGPDDTLSRMLETGAIDALHTARAPSTYDGPDGTVNRLFENYVEVEKAYYRKTGIFPIMHTIAIRREVYEKNRWIAQSLYKAFCEAKRRTYEDLKESAALKAMLPWLPAHVNETIQEMGEDYWSYGFHENRDVITTFLRYHHEQGLSPRILEPEDLFTPETMESFKI